jgi:hypothetical protein
VPSRAFFPLFDQRTNFCPASDMQPPHILG